MRRRLILLALPLLAYGAQTVEKPLLGEATFKPSSADVTANMGQDGVNVAITPGKDEYPGVSFTPKQGLWNLAKYGHISARIANSGPNPVTVSLRVDNAGPWQDNPWNTETVSLAAGEAKVVQVIFGYQYGMKKGYRLDPAKVVNLLVFTTKTNEPKAFRVQWIGAGGSAAETPPVAPDDVRVNPQSGVLFDARTPARLQASGNAVLSGATASFPEARDDAEVRVAPPVGRWDLRDATEVRVTLRNAGKAPATARLRIESNGGNGPWTAAPSLAPGEARTVVLPFFRRFELGASTEGITSDAVAAVALGTVKSPKGAAMEIVSVQAATQSAVLPTWLGKRPPVPGAWTKTLDENFDGTRLDPTVWKATGENYYDKVTHWSKQNVIVKSGVARLRYEKKRGFQNDDPKRNETPYTAGYLDTYGLWAQRYGYFEARVRVPRATGLWPAFWMMPDRGSKAAGPEQWKRQFTGDGAMEFDILESLTRWGPHRTNIAMHYDGYEKEHAALGSDKVYFETDKDGFVTCGLLWTPGEAVYYYNGKEVLRWKSPRVSNVPSILMFTLPSGGWDNDALDEERLPADFAIEYVRVWQRADLASPVDGKRKDPQTG